MATSLSLITEYIARQADPKDNPSIVFWALGELRRVQTSTSSIGEVLTNHDEAIKAILDTIGEGGGEPGLPGNCDCEDGTDGTDGQDGQDGRGVMVFQQSTVPSSSLSAPGDIWFSDNDILIMDTTRAWRSISGGSSDVINDSIVSLATTWSSSRLTSEFDQYLRRDEARHKLYGLVHTDVDTTAMIKESHGLFYQTGKFSPDYRMEFIDPYVLSDTYYPQQTVLVDGWTMCANKETTEYPAPASNDWDVVAPVEPASSLSDQDVRWVQASSTQLRFDLTATTDSTWTEVARFPIDIDTGVKATFTVDGKRTDAYGIYNADLTALAFNNGGVLDVHLRREELGQANLDSRVQSDGNDMVFEVKGRNNQDWTWGIAIFFRDFSG